MKYINSNEMSKILEVSERTVKVVIALDAILGNNFSLSEEKKAFYKKHIGNTFNFNVMFQKWIKENPDKTYKDSIDAYYKLKEIKKSLPGSNCYEDSDLIALEIND